MLGFNKPDAPIIFNGDNIQLVLENDSIFTLSGDGSGRWKIGHDNQLTLFFEPLSQDSDVTDSLTLFYRALQGSFKPRKESGKIIGLLTDNTYIQLISYQGEDSIYKPFFRRLKSTNSDLDICSTIKPSYHIWEPILISGPTNRLALIAPQSWKQTMVSGAIASSDSKFHVAFFPIEPNFSLNNTGYMEIWQPNPLIPVNERRGNGSTERGGSIHNSSYANCQQHLEWFRNEDLWVRTITNNDFSLRSETYGLESTAMVNNIINSIEIVPKNTVLEFDSINRISLQERMPVNRKKFDQEITPAGIYVREWLEKDSIVIKDDSSCIIHEERFHHMSRIIQGKWSLQGNKLIVRDERDREFILKFNDEGKLFYYGSKSSFLPFIKTAPPENNMIPKRQNRFIKYCVDTVRTLDTFPFDKYTLYDNIPDNSLIKEQDILWKDTTLTFDSYSIAISIPISSEGYHFWNKYFRCEPNTIQVPLLVNSEYENIVRIGELTISYNKPELSSDNYLLFGPVKTEEYEEMIYSTDDLIMTYIRKYDSLYMICRGRFPDALLTVRHLLDSIKVGSSK